MNHRVSTTLLLSTSLASLIACGGPEHDDPGLDPTLELEAAEAALDDDDPNDPGGGGRVGPVTAATLLRVTTLAHDRAEVNFRCGRNTDSHSLYATPQEGGAARYAGTTQCTVGQSKWIHDRDVEPGRAYCWRVLATNSENEAWSTSTCATVPLDYNPVAAPGLTISDVTQTGAHFVIDDRSNNEGGFRIQMLEGGAWITTHTVLRNTRRHAPIGLLPRVGDHRFTPGTTRQFRAEAFKEYAPAVAHSPTLTVHFPDVPPSAPTNLRVIGREEHAITLAWDDATGEDGYRIKADITADTDEEQTVGAGVTQHRFYSIASGYSVCFTVFAFNSGGSARSNEVCTQTLTEPPGERSADLRLDPDPPVSGLLPFVGRFPEIGVATGDVQSVEVPTANSSSLLQMTFIPPGAPTSACADPMRAVTVPRGGRLDGTALMKLYGDATPPLPIAFKACIAINSQTIPTPLLRIHWFGH